jgi:hypothetical protein
VQELKAYQNKILKKMVGLKKKGECGEFRRLQNDKLSDQSS